MATPPFFPPIPTRAPFPPMSPLAAQLSVMSKPAWPQDRISGARRCKGLNSSSSPFSYFCDNVNYSYPVS
ncbi:hypothetical protein E2C01_073027 [Portunus trituberculatus]|uniref:Uncharacterized protein n=1 Tax=Portunus trituberculatus TaxID=210409 RepID=A0A5B7I9I6_PORTR|nr:hypothetical protein [Portunus trituberculatus]